MILIVIVNYIANGMNNCIYYVAGSKTSWMISLDFITRFFVPLYFYICITSFLLVALINIWCALESEPSMRANEPFMALHLLVVFMILVSLSV